MAAQNWNLLNKEGVDVTAQYAITSTTPEYPAAPFAVGEHVLGELGTEWMFVLAATTIAAGAAVGIDLNFNASALTATLATNGYQIGFAQTAITNGNYGWVAIRGNSLNVLTKGTVAKFGKLYASTSAGILVGTTSYTQVFGTANQTSNATTSTITRVALATWPRALS